MNKLSFFFTVLSFAALSQDLKQQQIDTLNARFRKDSAEIFGFKKIRPFVNYHERNSIGNPKIVNFFGPQIGMLVKERHITGFGIYFSSPNTKKPVHVIDETADALKKINITYMTAFYQYILIQSRYVELHTPLETGYGVLKYTYSDLGGHTYKGGDHNFAMAAAGVQVIVKPLKWLGLSGICGYRAAQETVINGYFYAVGVWIGLKPLLMDIKYLQRKKTYRRDLKKVNNAG